MSKAIRPSDRFKVSHPLLLLCVLLVIVQVAGGASRPDALGQAVVRGAAWALMIVAVLFGIRPNERMRRPAVLLLAGIVALPLLQLIRLPPSFWGALPGRDLIIQATMEQPWRPWSIVPAATVNALLSLVVPAAALWLTLSLDKEERARLPGVLLCLVLASTLVGLIQSLNLAFDNPLVNETPRTVSGTFANRNHFALQLAMGCVLALAWAFADQSARPSRSVIGLALVLLFILTALVSGSRMGMLLIGLGLATGFLLSAARLRKAVSRSPRWAFPALTAGATVIIMFLVLIGVAAGRARSIDRLFAADPGQDMRARGLPTVWSMLREYFPAGSGLGSFDPIFRIHEPFNLLKPTYFNHAHNDFIEILIDTGLPGLLLLLAAIGWWGWASIRAWRVSTGSHVALPKLGSAMLLLVMVASVVDYPARTPTIMAWMAIAAVWLSGHTGTKRAKALPEAA